VINFSYFHNPFIKRGKYAMLVIILAAGRGTRMKSEFPKVLLPAAGKPMIDYSVELAKSLNPEKIVAVAGYAAELIKGHLKGTGALVVVQKEQLGTAHAVLSAKKFIKGYHGSVVILYGDMPNLSADTLKKFISEADKSAVSFISVMSKNPKGYGRVVRSPLSDIIGIVEEQDANDAEKKINEVNTGVYLASAALLLERLPAIGNSNAQREYYLTDIIKKGGKAWKAEDENEFLGANTRSELAQLSKIIWKKRAESYMAEGVSIIDPSSVYISSVAEIGKDVTLYPNTYIEGKSVIKTGSVVFPGVRISDSEIGENCVLKDNTLIEDSFVGDGSIVGPMAHLRPGTRLSGNNSVGNFVEIKKTALGPGAKANHLTYLGDARIGGGTNIGCGTITCNYDGFNKYETTIGSNVFVGSDVQFIAPVSIGDGAVIGAGSTITVDVEENALAISRSPQKNLKGKAEKYRKIKQTSKGSKE
jgi:bifunctional UDP-N-acetylglucosamine pyrophosphorylase/glucosamine-1-phosphate N-acetyltransferase